MQSKTLAPKESIIIPSMKTEVKYNYYKSKEGINEKK